MKYESCMKILFQLKKENMKINTAMILAAGYGKRLMPITLNTPKPMIKVYDKPLLGYAIDTLLSIGIKNIFINTHYKSDIISDYINSDYKSLKIFQIYESNLLDTAGGVKNASEFFNEKIVMVINCDTFWNSKIRKDLSNLLSSFEIEKYKCLLLLSEKLNTYGLNNKSGDFILEDGNLSRSNEINKDYYYTGAQIINTDVFHIFNNKVFSFNRVWDELINRKEISAILTKSKILHLGNLQSFSYLNEFGT